MIVRQCRLGAFAAVLLVAQAIIAQGDRPSDWVEGSSANHGGATRDYYNRSARLPWRNLLGDWRDAKDQPQGSIPYAVADVRDRDAAQKVAWDATTLVNEWLSGKHPAQGVFLRTVSNSGKAFFASREHADAKLRPTLTLEFENDRRELSPSADSYLTGSTYRCQGDQAEIRVSSTPEHALLRFDLREITTANSSQSHGKLRHATLLLHSTKQYGDATIGLFRCRQGHDDAESDPLFGIAAAYPNDEGIAEDPRVVMACDFDSERWKIEWTQVAPENRIGIESVDSARHGFEPLGESALWSRIAKGETTALNTLFRFRPKTGTEPEEIYFRYYLRLADDWNQTVQGGKLPGISGTYNRGGWGGRKSDGLNGWSARGLFRETIPDGNPLGGKTPIGFYCYHADMKDRYGDNLIWMRGYRGYLDTNRWYAIEQYCKLNTPGENDGILRAWVDGRPAFERTDLRFRLTDKLRIEQVWMNLYHGGTIPSPYDQHIFIDNVVIATEYIGPLR